MRLNTQACFTGLYFNSPWLFLDGLEYVRTFVNHMGSEVICKSWSSCVIALPEAFLHSFALHNEHTKLVLQHHSHTLQQQWQWIHFVCNECSCILQGHVHWSVQEPFATWIPANFGKCTGSHTIAKVLMSHGLQICRMLQDTTGWICPKYFFILKVSPKSLNSPNHTI